MKPLALTIVLFFSASLLAQVGLSNPVVTNGVGQPLAGVSVAICTNNPGATLNPPCQEAGNSLLATYTTSNLSLACTPNLSPLGPLNGSGCSNPGMTDALGNFVVYGKQGNGLAWYEVYGNGITSYAAPVFFTFSGISGTVNIADISTGTVAQGFGDSFAACFGVSPSTFCWQNVFATEKILSLTNSGVSSTGVADPGQFGLVVQLINTPPYGSFMYCCAINDMRNNLTAGQQGLWQQSYEALLWWLATPESNKVRSTSAAVTYNATGGSHWVLPPSNYSGNMIGTSTNGDTASFSVYGSDIVVIGGYQVGNSSTWNLTIDGSYTTPTVTTSANSYPTVAFNTNYGPNFVHITGLVEQTHSVVFTCVSASAGNPCYFIAGGSSFGVGATGPFVYALETTKLVNGCGANCGYHLLSVNCADPCGSDALVAQFDMLEAQAVHDLANVGLNLILAPLNAAYVPVLNVTTQSDGVHPNNVGSTQIGGALIAAAKGYLTPMDRSASQTLTSLNPCTANAGNGGIFAIGGLGVGAANACPPGMLRGDGAFSEFETIGQVFFGHDGGAALKRNGNNWIISAPNLALFQLGGTDSSHAAFTGLISPPILSARAADNSADIPVKALGFISTATTGNSPLTITSTTPVANLNSSPVTYEISGTQDANPHLVRGFCTLGTNCSITLVGSAIFSATANYNCFAQDEASAAATKIVRSSASAFIITGTGTDNISYMCVGF